MKKSRTVKKNVAGQYSRYPAIFTLLVFLVGIAAGLPPAGDAIIDFGHYSGSSAGWVWIWVTVAAALISVIVYEFEYFHEIHK